MMPQFFLTAAFVIAIDQFVKFFIKTHMKLYGSITVIPHIFNITYIENFGIAFGLTGQGENQVKRWILCGVIFAAVVMIIVYWLKNRHKSFLYNFSLGLITGGAVGNLIDRVLRGSVTDFIEVGYKQLTWPVFNTADSAVSVGVCLFILYLLITKDKIVEVKNAPDTV
jgi:signal peptidase II